MKKLYILTATVILTISTFAQAPEKMSYQAVVRDVNNTLVADQAVGMQLSILQDSITGTAVYIETQTPTTNANGLISTEIGSGTVVSGSFGTIDWNAGPYFIKTEIDPAGATDYTITSTSQLMSVPYALYANTAKNVLWTLTGNDIYNNNSGNVGVGSPTPSSLFEVGSVDTNSVVSIGHISSFNNPYSGELIFSEDLDYPSFCGIKFQLNGSTNDLNLIGGCPSPDTIGRFNRNGYSNFKTLRIGSNILTNPTSTLTVDGDIQVNGNVNITGNISKSSGTFKIDHPLDPKNKYLIHSFVESPEMMNIFSGNITTDEKGIAYVHMPDYFEAANKNFRYQLTVIGTFAQAVVKEKIKNNVFIIETDKPNVEVSWAVTSVRADKYAEKYPVVPVVEKDLKGTYIHPELYGAGKEKSEDAAKLKLLEEKSVKSGNADCN